jgi:hypothetical protein
VPDDPRGEALKEPPPVLIRPVPTKEAACIAGDRSDQLLGKLRRANKPLGGTARRRVAQLTDIIEIYPKKATALRKWADREYPSE